METSGRDAAIEKQVTENGWRTYRAVDLVVVVVACVRLRLLLLLLLLGGTIKKL